MVFYLVFIQVYKAIFTSPSSAKGISEEEDNAENMPPAVTNLLFFFSSSSDMRLPYVPHFTYLYTSLPAGEHELPNTCTTCVCLMVNIPFPSIYHMSNMRNMHVHDTFVLLFKPVVSCSISLASH
jgi:hypothetical protein